MFICIAVAATPRFGDVGSCLLCVNGMNRC